MQKLLIRFFILCGFSFSALSADNSRVLLDANILYTIPNAGGSDNFHTGKIVNLNGNYYVLPWLALNGGIFFSEEISDNTSSDIAGTYQASIQTEGLTLGIRPEYAFSKRNKIYSRLGLVFYKTDLTVNEYFAPGLPSGSVSSNTDGNGYLLSLGWAHNFTPQVSFQLELYNQTQLDLFDGKAEANSVFDISYSGFSLGIGYAF